MYLSVSSCLCLGVCEPVCESVSVCVCVCVCVWHTLFDAMIHRTSRVYILHHVYIASVLRYFISAPPS